MTSALTPRWAIDTERETDGSLAQTLSLFLVGAKCPFRCVYCDLGDAMIDGATPVGSLPNQIRLGIAAAQVDCNTIKLYNASNFFEKRAVPSVDDATIAQLVSAYQRVVVECHPRLIGGRMERFADALPGALEVAMGLETVHPAALPRLQKAMSLEDYDRAAERIDKHGCTHRAFVLICAPFVPPEASLEWTVKTARYAAERGARMISLIPLRPRVGSAVPMFAPSLVAVEQALEGSLQAAPGAVVQVDPWALAHLSACPACSQVRQQRIVRMNLSGAIEPPVQCLTCPE